MPATTAKQKWIRAAAVLLFGLALVIVLAPVWSPWGLRPVLGKFGVHYQTHDRIGWSRLALNEVKYEEGPVRFEADRIECLQPLVWLWHGWLEGSTDPGKPETPVLKARGWELQIESVADSPEDSSKPEFSVYQIWTKAKDQIRLLDRWLPVAGLTNGMFRIAGEEIVCPSLGLNRGRLSGLFIHPRLGLTNQITADLSAPRLATVRAAIQPLEARLALELSDTASNLTVAGEVFWRTNQFQINAAFGRTGYLPEEARVESDDLQVPSKLLKLEEYQDLRATVKGWWTNGAVAMEVKANAQPRESANQLPGLELDIGLNGDLKSLQLSRAHVRVPGVEGDLTDPIRLDYAGNVLSTEAALHVDVDLSEQPWFPLAGRLKGRAVVTAPATNRESIQFELSGTNVSGYQIETRSIQFSGQYTDLRIAIDQVAATLADDSKFRGSGSFDLSARSFEKCEVECSGGYWNRFLPAGWSYEAVYLAGGLEGPWNHPAHEGYVAVTNVNSPAGAPFSGKLSWTGNGLRAANLDGQFTSANTRLKLIGEVGHEAGGVRLRIDEATAQNESGPVCELARPARISVNREAVPAGDPNWRVSVTNFDWHGGAGELELNGEVIWPRRGRLTLQARAMDSTDWERLLPASWKAVCQRLEVREAAVEASWNEGPVEFNLSTIASGTVSNVPPLELLLDVNGGTNGLKIERLVLSDPTGEVFNASGQLPLTLLPRTNRVSYGIEKNAPLELKAMLRSTNSLWEALAQQTGVRPHEGKVNLELAGTLADPGGRLILQAPSVEIIAHKVGTNDWPVITDAHAEFVLESGIASVKEFTVRVENQLVSLSGSIPVPSELWLRPWESGHLPDWDKATARARMDDARLAAFAGFLPGILLPQGRLDVDLNLQPGRQIEGGVRLSGAATRGMMPLGAIQDIEASLKFSGWKGEIESLTGVLGGQTATVTGQVNWKDWKDPDWKLHLEGGEIPLIRQPGLILRSDLDIDVTRQPGGTALIAGTVKLRDSYYLSDLRSLMPGRVNTPSRRPPYFSVIEEPYAGYRLDVKLEGDRFVRVRTPLFQGQLSADLKLGGTLKQPVSTGELSLDSGQVIFPFARLRINQGEIFITSENPYRPQLYITGTSQTLGYEVNVQITGPADEPVWEMTSSPPLSTEAIVLMLTAGEVPREDFSYSQSQRAGKLALFLGKNLLSGLRADESAEERLVIRSGEEVTSEGQETYSVEYKLTDRLSVVGEYDRFGDVNAGLKWRVYSK